MREKNENKRPAYENNIKKKKILYTINWNPRHYSYIHKKKKKKKLTSNSNSQPIFKLQCLSTSIHKDIHFYPIFFLIHEAKFHPFFIRESKPGKLFLWADQFCENKCKKSLQIGSPEEIKGTIYNTAHYGMNGPP